MSCHAVVYVTVTVPHVTVTLGVIFLFSI